MTPTQRKQLANILLKEGEENWRVERKPVRSFEWEPLASDHTIDYYLNQYRAVRIERVSTQTPLPIEHYKWGMVVKHRGSEWLVLGVDTFSLLLQYGKFIYPDAITEWRWPNETEWKPAFTETVEEKIVETLIVEGL